MDTYQVVPPSGEKKNHMSTSFAPVLREIDPPGYLKLPPAKVTVLLGVPSLVKISVNEVALFEVLAGVANVNVALPFNVAVNTFPLLQLIVLAVPVFPNAVTLSENTPEKIDLNQTG